MWLHVGHICSVGNVQMEQQIIEVVEQTAYHQYQASCSSKRYHQCFCIPHITRDHSNCARINTIWCTCKTCILSLDFARAGWRPYCDRISKIQELQSLGASEISQSHPFIREQKHESLPVTIVKALLCTVLLRQFAGKSLFSLSRHTPSSPATSVQQYFYYMRVTDSINSHKLENCDITQKLS